MSDELNKAMVPTPLMKIDDVVIQGRYNEDEHFRHFWQSDRSDNFLAVTSMASHRISDARFVLIRSWDTTGQLGADRHGVVHVLLLKWSPRLLGINFFFFSTRVLV